MILLLHLGCGTQSVDSPMTDQWPTVPATVVSQIAVDAVFPSDLLVRPDGTIWVLDGYHGRILPLSPDGQPGAPLGEDEGFGHPVRLAASASGGAWLVDPAGRLLELDDTGHVVRVIEVGATDAPDTTEGPRGPVALLEVGTALVVSDRHGGITWLGREDGAIARRVVADPEGTALSTVTDLVLAPDGSVVAADTVAGRVHHIRPDGGWKTFGRYGLWVGTLKQPKAVSAIDGGTFVADSALRAVQLFADDGSARGVVTVDGEPPPFQHPIALEREADGDLLVLDAATATVWTLRLDAPTLAKVLEEVPPRWHRKALVDATYAGPAGKDGRDCRQCHDGLVNDSRQLWDPALGHHPIQEPVEEPLPTFFSLDEQGEMTCTTCHSPHGASSLGDVAAVEGGADRDLLVRHAATEPFLRMSRNDSALCVACHGEEPHDDAVGSLGIGGGAHPVGIELAVRMEGRTEGSVDSVQCLGCHAVHGADGEHLTRGETDGRLCATCHTLEALPATSHPLGLTGAPTTPAPTGESELPLDAQNRATCRTCHDLVGGHGNGLVRLPADGSELCGACHAAAAREVSAGHAGVRGPAGIACLGCHDPHGAPVAVDLLQRTGTAGSGDPLACLGCHASGGRMGAPIVNAGRAGHPVDGVAHGEGTEPLTCGTCHEPHGPRARQTLCADCHADQVVAAGRGGHGGATCLACHPAHDNPRLAGAPNLNPASRVCLGCHLDPDPGSTMPVLASSTHPDLVFRPDGARWAVLAGLPLYDAKGAVVPPGANGDLACSSCHVTHGPDAAEPGDHLRRPGWKEVCTSCHGNDALPLYRYFHQPERRADLKGGP